MQLSTQTATGLYVYSFIHESDAANIAAEQLLGLNDAPIQWIARGDIATLVSPIAEKKIRPQRKLLAAHQAVATKVAEKWNALPVAFGLIADDEEHVRLLLERNGPILKSYLDRVSGKVEMSLSIEWVAPNIFQYFIDRHPDLQMARDKMAAGSVTRDEQIELGRQFEQRINAERTQWSDLIVSNLQPVCAEIEVQSVRSDHDVVRLACLIDRNHVERFDEAVYRAATLFNEDFRFTYNGPWPAYSFVKLALTMEEG